MNSPVTAERVLFLGESWWGSCTRACSSALRRLGCDVLQLDPQMPIRSSCRTISARILSRFTASQIARDYNQLILRTAEHFHPDLLLAFKGLAVRPKTLATLRQRGIPLYNYYPDRIALESSTELGKSISEYDCMFDTKPYWDCDAEQRVQVRERIFLPHGYDQDIHRPLQLNDKDWKQYGCDVSLIAGYSPRKEKILDNLMVINPNLDLRIWGDAWSRGTSSRLKAHIQDWAPFGDQYIRAIQASKINLGIMGITADVRDTTTTRTYEIPACDGFMLHERNSEVLELYKEDEEVACFDSAEELAQKIDFFLLHPEERKKIAKAGHARCVPAYSYDKRVAEILLYHRQGRTSQATYNKSSTLVPN